jgi:hypothetical protein
MKKSLSFFAALGVGLSCVALLIWLWRENQENLRQLRAAQAERNAPAVPDRAEPAAAIAKVIAAPDVSAQVLLAALERLLARSDARANEGVLTFKDDDAYRRFVARARAAGLTIVGELPGLRSVRVRYDSPAALAADLAQFASDYGDVAGNYLVGIPSGPPAKEDRAAINQVPFGNSTLQFLGVPAEHSDWGKGVTIAILDTGVQPDPTFGADGRLRTLDIGLGTTVGHGEEDGHGTAIAALAAGASKDAGGVAPAASLLSIRVTDESGTSDTFTVAQGIVAAVNAGAKVINISLGGYSTNAALDAAIGYAVSRGSVIVAAAGNDQAAQLAWPAADARVVSVGAVDRAGQQVTFSNSGPQLCLTAPGYGVQTAWLDNQRVYVNGTSASSPLVAGAIAATLSQNSALTPQTAAQLLSQTASDAGAPGTDSDYGNGVLNLDWAMHRNDTAHYDPAIASHYYDAANSRMQFVVQNRSGSAVSGLQLNVNSSGATTNTASFTIPSLAAGEIYVATVPVDPVALKSAGSITYLTQLANPPGLSDSATQNNRKSSTLTAPAAPASPTK